MDGEVWVPLGPGAVRFVEEIIQPAWRAVAEQADTEGGPPYRFPALLPLPTTGKAMVASGRDMAFFMGVVGGVEAQAMKLSIEITEAIG